MYARLLAADLPADTFASARACVSAGERLPAEVYRAWRARFGVEILDGIGATETIFMVLSSRPGAESRGIHGDAGARHRGAPAGRRRRAGGARRAGRALGADAVPGPGLLAAARGHRPGLRRGVVPHRRRILRGRRRALGPLRPPGRSLQGRGAMGGAGGRGGRRPPASRRARGGAGGRGGGLGAGEAVSLRGAARGAGGCRRAGRRAARAAGARGARACASPRDHRGARAAAHGHGQAPAVPAARSPRRVSSRRGRTCP